MLSLRRGSLGDLRLWETGVVREAERWRPEENDLCRACRYTEAEESELIWLKNIYLKKSWCLGPRTVIFSVVTITFDVIDTQKIFFKRNSPFVFQKTRRSCLEQHEGASQSFSVFGFALSWNAE